VEAAEATEEGGGVASEGGSGEGGQVSVQHA